MKQIVEIPYYIKRVKLSNARRPKYFEKDASTNKVKPKELPKRYCNRDKYEWRKYNGRNILFDSTTNERVVANPRAQGTPHYITINGQGIYNGKIKEHTRHKVMSEIKKSFKDGIETLKPIVDYPIILTIEVWDYPFTDETHANSWDLDNRSGPYLKGFQDSLTGNLGQFKQILTDDDVFHVTGFTVKYVPIDDPKEFKLVFKLEEDLDPRLKQSKIYQKFRK